MNSAQRSGIIALIIVITTAYAFYEKSLVDKLVESSEDLIVKEAPTFRLVDGKGSPIAKEDVFRNDLGVTFVHFWATWCGPCEAELPEFVEFAQSLENTKSSFLIVAVKDDRVKVKKFLKRFSSFPRNIRFAFDDDGSMMRDFGTLKLPETYLLQNSGRIYKKYAGAQAWLEEYYKGEVARALAL